MPCTINFVGTIARWLPKDPDVIREYHHNHLVELAKNGIFTAAGDVDEKQLSLVILEFKKVIEDNSELFRDFHEMFEQVPPNPNPGQKSITNYLELLAVLDRTITLAPTYSYTSPLVSGVPMYGVLAPFCNTQAGYHAFTSAKVNAVFHKLFNEWTRFLLSPASRNVLVDTEGGWFSPEAMKVQDDRLGMPFDRAWVCYPEKDNMGFTSWDDFFVRRFREGIRPTIAPSNPRLINAACEAITYRVVSGAQATDQFWLKDMPYSLDHILNYHPLASQLVGGTVFQAMLSSLDYHRWHSPVDGRVVAVQIVPGTYYAGRLDDDQDPDIISRSQAFVTAISTRALIFIESDNANIGLMCFVGVGLGEISTTKVEVREGDVLKKGDELGSFHFGGSTHLLIFRPETQLTLEDGPDDPNEARKVGSVLFCVDNPPVQ
ncbi:Phophatidylserine decarboxylase-domain-containing protein [Melanogaster broomeanus]|nr:Phophatidylserine decarboxylase-domain-containing protein [Melanogaster broomeanus]